MIRNFIGAECGHAAADTFQPPRADTGARERGCFTCSYFRGQFKAEHVVCERFERDRVIGDARIGCAYWMREPGADD